MNDKEVNTIYTNLTDALHTMSAPDARVGKDASRTHTRTEVGANAAVHGRSTAAAANTTSHPRSHASHSTERSVILDDEVFGSPDFCALGFVNNITHRVLHPVLRTHQSTSPLSLCASPTQSRRIKEDSHTSAAGIDYAHIAAQLSVALEEAEKTMARQLTQEVSHVDGLTRQRQRAGMRQTRQISQLRSSLDASWTHLHAMEQHVRQAQAITAEVEQPLIQSHARMRRGQALARLLQLWRALTALSAEPMTRVLRLLTRARASQREAVTSWWQHMQEDENENDDAQQQESESEEGDVKHGRGGAAARRAKECWDFYTARVPTSEQRATPAMAESATKPVEENDKNNNKPTAAAAVVLKQTHTQTNDTEEEGKEKPVEEMPTLPKRVGTRRIIRQRRHAPLLKEEAIVGDDANAHEGVARDNTAHDINVTNNNSMITHNSMHSSKEDEEANAAAMPPPTASLEAHPLSAARRRLRRQTTPFHTSHMAGEPAHEHDPRETAAIAAGLDERLALRRHTEAQVRWCQQLIQLSHEQPVEQLAGEALPLVTLSDSVTRYVSWLANELVLDVLHLISCFEALYEINPQAARRSRYGAALLSTISRVSRLHRRLQAAMAHSCCTPLQQQQQQQQEQEQQKSREKEEPIPASLVSVILNRVVSEMGVTLLSLHSPDPPPVQPPLPTPVNASELAMEHFRRHTDAALQGAFIFIQRELRRDAVVLGAVLGGGGGGGGGAGTERGRAVEQAHHVWFDLNRPHKDDSEYDTCENEYAYEACDAAAHGWYALLLPGVLDATAAYEQLVARVTEGVVQPFVQQQIKLAETYRTALLHAEALLTPRGCRRCAVRVADAIAYHRTVEVRLFELYESYVSDVMQYFNRVYSRDAPNHTDHSNSNGNMNYMCQDRCGGMHAGASADSHSLCWPACSRTFTTKGVSDDDDADDAVLRRPCAALGETLSRARHRIFIGRAEYSASSDELALLQRYDALMDAEHEKEHEGHRRTRLARTSDASSCAVWEVQERHMTQLRGYVQRLEEAAARVRRYAAPAARRQERLTELAHATLQRVVHRVTEELNRVNECIRADRPQWSLPPASEAAVLQPSPTRATESHVAGLRWLVFARSALMTVEAAVMRECDGAVHGEDECECVRVAVEEEASAAWRRMRATTTTMLYELDDAAERVLSMCAQAIVVRALFILVHFQGKSDFLPKTATNSTTINTLSAAASSVLSFSSRRDGAVNESSTETAAAAAKKNKKKTKNKSSEEGGGVVATPPCTRACTLFCLYLSRQLDEAKEFIRLSHGPRRVRAEEEEEDENGSGSGRSSRATASTRTEHTYSVSAASHAHHHRDAGSLWASLFRPYAHLTEVKTRVSWEEAVAPEADEESPLSETRRAGGNECVSQRASRRRARELSMGEMLHGDGSPSSFVRTVGVCLYRGIAAHLKSFWANERGALIYEQDVRAYRAAVAPLTAMPGLGAAVVERLFAMLQATSRLLTAPLSELKQVRDSRPLRGMSKEEKMQFMRIRHDLRAAFHVMDG